MAKNRALLGWVHLVPIPEPGKFDTPQRVVRVSLRLFEQYLLVHTPSQGSECVKGRLRRLDVEMDLVREKGLSVGVLQFRRLGQGIANIEIDGANLVGIPRKVGGGKFAVLPLDLAL